MRFIRSFYIRNLFFYCLLALATLFVLSFFMKALFIPVIVLFWGFVAACTWDLVFLYVGRGRMEIRRRYPEKLSNGDENELEIELSNHYPLAMQVRVLEEFPMQLQVRDWELKTKLQSKEVKVLTFAVRPTSRGRYVFGRCHALVRHIGLFERKFRLDESLTLACYPSFIQMRKYQLMATTDRLVEMGVKRIRKIGATLEFDHIREYVRGDDYRHLNWRATAKHKKLLVNQYQEEKSQPIYALIDTGRVMRMPFQGLTLLDYAINSALVLTNAAILKQDRAGMLTFSKEVGNYVAAEKRNNQMQRIADKLYAVQTEFEETEFGQLYAYCNKHINKRSLLLLYTNFETIDALSRQMPYLRMLAKSHILVVVVFKNTELVDMSHEAGKKVIDVYNQIIAEKFVYEKHLIVQELHRQGIQTIYTAPENLTIQAINKYLEIKARGLL
ncbi:Uncharacterized conserved protein, DUF58 family, contains vWF domain [Sphingobacterium psychroaquaticum]|uniref:Uncharacterized conserved protein, DUF58 family, contains vWF domain n=2 Tax=Sphingobacterium psychroaquaticum TaxID=561061 RepID=A0A1X7KJU5_9SPHI|nr:Uncharacterized conserved protein, DUF58 family, contains vWF domain [Sphingobacterium psychroaquaticum]